MVNPTTSSLSTGCGWRVPGAGRSRNAWGMDDTQKYPAIRDTESLCRFWQIVLEEQGSDERTLWIAWIDAEGVREPVIAGFGLL